MHYETTVGMPNVRTPPCGFGISTLRTAAGMYSPANSACLTLGQCALQPWLERGHRQSIDSRRAFVLHHALVGA